MANGQFDTSIRWPQVAPFSGGQLIYDPATGLPITKHRCPTGFCDVCMNAPEYDYDAPVNFCVTILNVADAGPDGAQWGFCYTDADVPLGASGFPDSRIKAVRRDSFMRTWACGALNPVVVSDPDAAFCVAPHVNTVADGFLVGASWEWNGDPGSTECPDYNDPADVPAHGFQTGQFTVYCNVSKNLATGRRYMEVRADGGVGPVFWGQIELTDPGCAADAGYVIPNQLYTRRYPCPILGPPNEGGEQWVIGWQEPNPHTGWECFCRTITDATGKYLECRDDPETIPTRADSKLSGNPATNGFLPMGVGGYAVVKPMLGGSACTDVPFICGTIWTKRYDCLNAAWGSTVKQFTGCVPATVQGWQQVGGGRPSSNGGVPYIDFMCVTSSGSCDGYGEACEDGPTPADPATPTGCPTCSDVDPDCPTVKLHFNRTGYEDVVITVDPDDNSVWVGTGLSITCTNGVRIMTLTDGTHHATWHQIDDGDPINFDWHLWAKTEDTFAGGDTAITGFDCVDCPTDYAGLCSRVAVTLHGTYGDESDTVTLHPTLSADTWTDTQEDTHTAHDVTVTIACSGGIYTIEASGLGLLGDVTLHWTAPANDDGSPPFDDLDAWTRTETVADYELTFIGCDECPDTITVTVSGGCGPLSVTMYRDPDTGHYLSLDGLSGLTWSEGLGWTLDFTDPDNALHYAQWQYAPGTADCPNLDPAAYSTMSSSLDCGSGWTVASIT